LSLGVDSSDVFPVEFLLVLAELVLLLLALLELEFELAVWNGRDSGVDDGSISTVWNV
jgi:hypothetical protein